MFQDIEGNTFGVRTRSNLAYYSSDTYVIGIDFSSKMLQKQQKRAQSKATVTLKEIDVQQMNLPDSIFQTYLSGAYWM